MRLLMVSLLVMSLSWPVFAATPPTVDLIDAMDRGLVNASFRGAGDRGVTADLERVTDEPLLVAVAPGTQFWAQAGGRQGQTNVGRNVVDMTQTRLAFVTLHTCCTNLGLPSAKAEDLMIPVASPSLQLAALLSLPRIDEQPHMAVQAAVWAVSTNPSPITIRRALAQELPRTSTHAERLQFAGAMVTTAAELVRQAGLKPAQYRLFR